MSFESVDCLLPLLLPSVEVPVERADELHPPLRRAIMITMMMVEAVKKSRTRSYLHSGKDDHKYHDKQEEDNTCTVARRKAG